MRWFGKKKPKPEINEPDSARIRREKADGTLARKARAGDKDAVRETRKHYERLQQEARDIKKPKDNNR